MKTVTEVLGKIKGEDKLDAVMTGKGAFSKAGFNDTVNALVNDTTFKVKTYDKDGKETGALSISDLIRSDLQKTIAKAGYPQKTEAGVLDTCEICTTGLAEAIPQIVMQQLAMGKKFDLPNMPKVQGSIHLAPVKGKTKEIKVRDPKTQQDLGTATISTKDSIQVRAVSPVPAYLKSKVRKDTSGKVIN